jgi:hypothetical protein
LGGGKGSEAKISERRKERELMKRSEGNKIRGPNKISERSGAPRVRKFARERRGKWERKASRGKGQVREDR